MSATGTPSASSGFGTACRIVPWGAAVASIPSTLWCHGVSHARAFYMCAGPYEFLQLSTYIFGYGHFSTGFHSRTIQNRKINLPARRKRQELGNLFSRSEKKQRDIRMDEAVLQRRTAIPAQWRDITTSINFIVEASISR